MDAGCHQGKFLLPRALLPISSIFHLPRETPGLQVCQDSPLLRKPPGSTCHHPHLPAFSLRSRGGMARSSHAQTVTALGPYSSCLAMGMVPHAGRQVGFGTLVVPPQIWVTQGLGTWFGDPAVLPSPLLACSGTQQLSSSRHLGRPGATGTSASFSPCDGGLGGTPKPLRVAPCDSQNPQLRAVMGV